MNTQTNIVKMASRKTLCLLLSASLLLAGTQAHAGKVTRYVHTDHLGSPVAKTDSTGAVIWRQSYTPDGEAYQLPDPDGPGFTGHRNDAATGLVYMQARYYDPVIGRFLSVDPVAFSPDQPQQFNRYWYANGNPYSYVDPDGEFGVGALIVVVGIALAAVTVVALVKSANNFKDDLNKLEEIVDKSEFKKGDDVREWANDYVESYGERVEATVDAAQSGGKLAVEAVEAAATGPKPAPKDVAEAATDAANAAVSAAAKSEATDNENQQNKNGDELKK